MKHNSISEMTAYDEGGLAFIHGLRAVDNPYAYQSIYWYSWKSGYYDTKNYFENTFSERSEQ